MVALIISIQIQILFMFHWWCSSSSTCIMWFVTCTSFDVLKTCFRQLAHCISILSHFLLFMYMYFLSGFFSLCTCLWFTFLRSCTCWRTVWSTTHKNTDNENLWMMQIIAIILTWKKKGWRKQDVLSNIWCLPTRLRIFIYIYIIFLCVCVCVCERTLVWHHPSFFSPFFSIPESDRIDL